MQNKGLASDYLKRAFHRLAVLDVLFDKEDWADVVRESQEAVELALKGLLRSVQVEPPRVHDVSEILIQKKDLMPPKIQPHVDQMANISRSLRRDRELAFYGTEDLTPSEFYKKEDAEQARSQAKWLVEVCQVALLKT